MKGRALRLGVSELDQESYLPLLTKSGFFCVGRARRLVSTV